MFEFGNHINRVTNPFFHSGIVFHILRESSIDGFTGRMREDWPYLNRKIHNLGDDDVVGVVLRQNEKRFKLLEFRFVEVFSTLRKTSSI